MKIDKKHYELSFDRFSRQARAFDVIEALRKDGQKFKILDVGGYRGVTRDFHVQDDVTVMDLYDIEEPGYIRGNALEMPFKDASFDFVVSFDVFEHIDNDNRYKFLSESFRVARVAVITAAPISTEANESAEAYLNDLHSRLYGKDHEWLKEHIDYGLPKPDQAKEILEKLGLSTIVFGSNDTVFWIMMQGAIFLNAKFNEGEKSLAKLNSIYNEIAYNDGTQDPLDSYRHVVCGFKSQTDASAAKEYLGRHSAYLNQLERAGVAKIINDHYTQTLTNYTELYEKLYEKFKEKVAEKDILLETIKNLEKKESPISKKIARLKSGLNKMAGRDS